MTDKDHDTLRQLRQVPKHGFLVLLISLLSLLVIPAYFPPADRALFMVIIVSCILLASLYLVANKKRELVIGSILIAPALVTSWLGYIPSSSFQVNLNNFLNIIFLSYIIFHLARYMFEPNEVSADMIYASMCLYLMLGLIWTFIYLSIETRNPGSFSLSIGDTDNTPNPRRLMSQLSYYSYVTLSTLGYGDIAPLTRLARSWATIEAMIGQFYLAIVVARLVGLHISSAKR